ncbi:Serine/threonine-protein kinase ppk18 [Elsinoe australis]|uniref:Serine/threonine-protein kinase ppk18 n=1 Tax=Elsinoe australis TaxID=40998 RepID=A0A2P8A0K5_9PEZI|nr:Serine/threonine-protein kinase ppk18 [Elsinoe australis]
MSPYLSSPPQNTQPSPAPRPPASTLHLPRILCLHGGGVNAEVFTLQCRAITHTLSSTFRLVFADGPHFCGPGPDITLVYSAYGPFRRWLRWKPNEHAEIDNEAATDEIMYCIKRAMDEDEGTGDWVGVLGFSQGAKVAASLLYDTQCRREKTGKAEWDWKFAVVMQGRHPLVSFSEYSRHPGVCEAGAVSEGWDYQGEFDRKLKLPSIHVHGLQDAGLELHRRMMNQYCDPKSVTLVEWNGAHRLPIKTEDVNKVCQAIWKVARQQGIQC